MNPRFPIRIRRNRAAFSLVEVCLAVAVVAIGLLAVIGLFPQGLQSARDAADNTMSATIVQDLLSQLRGGTFNNVVISVPAATPSNVVIDLTSSFILRNTFDFDQDGAITSDPAASYYRVNLTTAPVLGLPGVSLPGVSFVQASIAWPYHSSKANINTNIFMTEVARYGNP